MTSLPGPEAFRFQFFDVPSTPASGLVPTSLSRPHFTRSLSARRSSSNAVGSLPTTTDLRSIKSRRRTLLALDGNNLICSAQDLGLRFDDVALLRAIRDASRASSLNATAVLSAEEPRLSQHRQRLEGAGYTVVGEVAHRIAGKLKANMDPALAGVVTKAVLRDRVTQIVLGSGDGDFAGLIRFLRKQTKRPLRFVVVGVRGSIARVLCEAADATVELGQDVLRPFAQAG
jgi:uncharacterized LabA/DUF88 family protein